MSGRLYSLTFDILVMHLRSPPEHSVIIRYGVIKLAKKAGLQDGHI